MGISDRNSPVYRYIAIIKGLPSLKVCVFLFGFRKGKTGNLIALSSEQRLVFGLIYSMLGCDWSGRRLLWMDRVLLYLVGDGMK